MLKHGATKIIALSRVSTRHYNLNDREDTVIGDAKSFLLVLDSWL